MCGDCVEKEYPNRVEQKKICAVYGEGAVTDRMCQKWFAKCSAGDFSLDDAPRPGRPVEADSDRIETVIDNNQRYTMWKIVDILKISKSTKLLGNICLENGSFLLNFTGCAVCGKRDFMLITNKSLKEEDGEEIVTYDHLCKNCHHVVARHEYTFSIMDEFQEYTMLCLLCGKAEDTISILPDDPRQMTLLF